MHALPSQIRGYEVWGRLNEGGMSEVWLAKHLALSIPVIVKTMRPDVRDQIGVKVAEERLLSEARLMARLHNPRVVRAIDAGVIDETPFFVEEYVDGIDLAELDGRRRRAIGVGLPLFFVAFVMGEICDALHSAHQAGVIHRDVKPSNVFGSPDGIRLGDFGIAILRSEAARAQASGTVRFMAPEQFAGGDGVDRRVDVWGAGATACDLRYGHPPFESIEELNDPNLRPKMPPPSSPEEAFFQNVIESMLEKNRDKRTTTCAEAARRFRALARSITPTQQGAIPIDKHALRIGATTIAFDVGDISQSKADAIINSAYYAMTMQSGVGDALRRRGGDEIERAAIDAGEQALGSCIVTGAGSLDAKYVLHAVSAWNEVSCVGRAISRGLLTADELGCKTVAMPALGTGAGRVQFEMCASSMIRALKWRALLGGMRAREFHIVLPDETKRNIFQAVAEDALLDVDTVPLGHDLGLPIDAAEVRGEAATCLDAKSSVTDEDSE